MKKCIFCNNSFKNCNCITSNKFFKILMNEFKLTKKRIFTDLKMMSRNKPVLMSFKFFFNSDDLDLMREYYKDLKLT